LRSIGQWLDVNAKRLYFIFGRPLGNRSEQQLENPGVRGQMETQ